MSKNEEKKRFQQILIMIKMVKITILKRPDWKPMRHLRQLIERQDEAHARCYTKNVG